MPEYRLPVENEKEFSKLDPFVQGYIEAMFFTETDPTVSMDQFKEAGDFERTELFIDGNIPSDAGYDDLHPETVKAIIDDCAAFTQTNEGLLKLAFESAPQSAFGDQYNRESAGRDFWYSRNGHGVGYWDRGLGEVGDKLDKLAQSEGEVHVWVGDHVEYGDAPYIYCETPKMVVERGGYA